MTDGQKVLWGFLLLLAGMLSIFFGDLAFDFKMFIYDFSEVYGDGSTRTGRFLYHLGLMLQPTILTYIIYRHTEKMTFWRWASLATLLCFVKECIDVIISNNKTGTWQYELGVYLLIILWLAYIAYQWRKINNDGRSNR